MTKIKQIEKNLELSEKLATFIADNPEFVKDLPSNASFVTLSSTDEELNKSNMKLIESLVKEGKKVIKAIETKNASIPWTFIQVAL